MTARLFGLTGASSLNPAQNKRFAATLLAAVLLFVVIGAWALRASTAAGPVSNNGFSLNTGTKSSAEDNSAGSQQTSVSADSSSSSSGGSSSNSSSVNVSVNGRNIDVPQDSSFHKVIKSGNSTTTVDVNHSGTASNSNESSTYIQVDSDSSSTTVQGGG